MFYFMIFYLCSVLGLIIETAYSFVIRRRFTSRRTMVLSPVCTVYGFGGLAIYLVAQHFNTIVAILLGTLFAIVIEYVYGMVCKDYFGIKETELIFAQMLDVVGFDSEKIITETINKIKNKSL